MNRYMVCILTTALLTTSQTMQAFIPATSDPIIQTFNYLTSASKAIINQPLGINNQSFTNIDAIRQLLNTKNTSYPADAADRAMLISTSLQLAALTKNLSNTALRSNNLGFLLNSMVSLSRLLNSTIPQGRSHYYAELVYLAQILSQCQQALDLIVNDNNFSNISGQNILWRNCIVNLYNACTQLNTNTGLNISTTTLDTFMTGKTSSYTPSLQNFKDFSSYFTTFCTALANQTTDRSQRYAQSGASSYNGLVWCGGSNNNFFASQTNTMAIQRFTMNNSLNLTAQSGSLNIAYGTPMNLVADSTNNLWFTTSNNYLCNVNNSLTQQQGWQAIDPNSFSTRALLTNPTTALINQVPTTFVIAANNTLAYVQNNGSLQQLTISGSTLSGGTNQLCIDNQNNVWAVASGSETLYKISITYTNNQPTAAAAATISVPGRRINFITSDSLGYPLAVGANTAAGSKPILLQFNLNGTVNQIFSFNESINIANIVDTDSQNNFWVFDNQRSFIKINPTSGAQTTYPITLGASLALSPGRLVASGIALDNFDNPWLRTSNVNHLFTIIQDPQV